MARLTKDDWTGIALHAIADSGVAAVAVEPLAARAGVTKGSLYWHFPTRDALLAAALERWERDQTHTVIAAADRGRTPRERLRLLVTMILDPADDDTRVADVELALHAATAEPAVAAAVRRVAERRLEYLADQLVELGFSRPAARRRALIAYATYLGQVQLTHSAAWALPRSAAARRAYARDVLAVLLSDPASA